MSEAYPASLRQSGFGGEADLLAHIDARGRVEGSFVRQSSGFSDFDDLAIAALRRIRFTPALLGECAVPTWVSFRVSFSPR